MSKLSPMMVHYKELKKQYPDTIVLYRLGDFYEMFFDDAILASSILDLTLTGRDCGLKERAPMCGMPYHAVDSYIAKLIKCGQKVAICEQLSNPEDQKGMVKRDVVRVITAGTITEETMLDESKNNYLASVYYSAGGYGLSWCDISTGEFKVFEVRGKDKLFEIQDYILKLNPSEIIANTEFVNYKTQLKALKDNKRIVLQQYYDYAYDYDNARKSILNQTGIYDLKVFGLEKKDLAVSSAGAMLDYISTTQKMSLSNIKKINYINNKDFMFLDYNCKRNLELTETLCDNTKYGSLLWVLDKTYTNMGARELRKTIELPLQNPEKINARLDAVQELVHYQPLRVELSILLKRIRDIERLTTKISLGSIKPRECISIKESLDQIPNLKLTLSKFKSSPLMYSSKELNALEDLASLLTKSLKDNPPAVTKDGGYIADGYNELLDSYRNAQSSGKLWIAEYEAKERESTGIKTLKVGYNRVFGYYLEITNSQLSLTPYSYQRKQTLSTGERFITQELKDMEEKILGASEKAVKLENDIYGEIKEKLAECVDALLLNARIIAKLDVLLSFAQVSAERNYVRPQINKKIDYISIKNGRHPVVEAILADNEYVGNDTYIDKDNSTQIITGPNMAGKSTYMRQVALITLMAHIGCFVPADKAEIAITDRIFTRVGASDNLSQGQSTFMLEMIEVASILNYATPSSLLILDEIGRGTSTIDGLSIAWAITEYITNQIGAKTLFATHFHELTELETLMPKVKNYRILVKEDEESIVFLYKIKRGGTNKSFGIEVAEIAGVKCEVIKRAKKLMASLLASHELNGNLKEKINYCEDEIAEDYNDEKNILLDNLLRALKPIKVEEITPIEAFAIISELKGIAGDK